jgi:hypothetical protein
LRRIRSWCWSWKERTEGADLAHMRDQTHRIPRNHERQRAARAISVSLLVCAVLLGVQMATAYSVLTHEQVVDLLWKDQIEPPAEETVPAGDRAKSAGGARLCLRRVDDPRAGNSGRGRESNWKPCGRPAMSRRVIKLRAIQLPHKWFWEGRGFSRAAQSQ